MVTFAQTMPDVLRWTGHGETLQRVQEQYLRVVSEALGYVLAGIRDEDPSFAAKLESEWDTTSNVALLRVLLAPQTTCFLLSKRAMFREGGEFLKQALLAEKVKEGKQATLDRETWTALGDALILPTGKIVAGPSLEGLMSLDLDSPAVSNADPLGQQYVSSPWRPLRGTKREIALQRLGLAQRGIVRTSSVVSEFVSDFIKVLVLQGDEEQSFFSSYSSGQYIGRAVISNPHLVDEVQLAESMVHEAIHSLLYMQRQGDPWGMDVDDAVYDDVPSISSPWSGRRLPVSTYLHACFVWYGLLHFWSNALAADVFPARRVRGRMARAALGFVTAPLLERLEEADAALISSDVRSAIQEMQARVTRSFAYLDGEGESESTPRS